MITLAEVVSKKVGKLSAVDPKTVLAALGEELSYDDIIEGLYLFKPYEQKEILEGIEERWREFWDSIGVVEHYWYIHPQFPGMRKHIKKTLDSLNIKEDDKIVELACGIAPVLKEFLETREISSFQYTGIDFSERMLSVAHEQLSRKRKDKVQFINHDLTEGLPLPDNSADKILNNWGISTFPQDKIESVLGEVYRVLKPGGIFVSTAIVKGANFALLALRSFKEYFIESIKKIKIMKIGMKFGKKFKKLFPLYTKRQWEILITEVARLEIVEVYSTLSGRNITIVARKSTALGP